ncbi:uncharacterized protein LOC107039595 [Diachasma alloeum]|uniref:uncharacterized protein LOC107039595 n=1 Tax=Diachasma alloeum TaxID=454923 RepID=UPI0007382505|nr:uncharacterized protein LOC107039595 [Diachasma alloeum]
MPPTIAQNEPTTNIEQTPSTLLNMKSKDGSTKYPEGKRRRFLRELLVLEALKKFLPHPVDEPMSYEPTSSEYVDEYCLEDFVPILEKEEILTEKQVNYPLYGRSINKTIYNEKISAEILKRRSTVPNLHEPFRRNCSFTTPVADRLTE